jgi:hypothetical protein
MRWASFFMRSAEGSQLRDGAVTGIIPRQRSTSRSAVLKSTPMTACSNLKPPPGPHWRQW